MKERTTRLAALARKELADLLSQRKVKELANFEGLISITEVLVEKGYQHFRFYLSIFNSDNKSEVIESLENNSSMIRGELCRRLQLRVAPTLSFELDESLERGFKIDQLLDSIKEA